eukprot:8314227-Pyramimonas_sp.AAC.3
MYRKSHRRAPFRRDKNPSPPFSRRGAQEGGRVQNLRAQVRFPPSPPPPQHPTRPCPCLPSRAPHLFAYIPPVCRVLSMQWRWNSKRTHAVRTTGVPCRVRMVGLRGAYAGSTAKIQP